MGFVICDSDDGLHIVSHLFGSGFRQAGTGHIGTGQFGDAGTQYTGIAHRLPITCHMHGSQAPGNVGGGTHGGPLALSGGPVGHQCAVARGIDVRVVGAHVLIHQDGALEHLQAGISQPFCVGTEAHGQNDGVGLHRAFAGQHLFHLAFAGDTLQRHTGKGHDARPRHGVFQVLRNLRVQHFREDMGCKIDDGGLDAPVSQVFRNL